MELTLVTSIACIVPTNEKEALYTSFIPAHLQYKQLQDNEYQISIKDEKETSTWNVNHVRTPGTLPEYEQLINYALNGFDVASLSISVSNGTSQDMYQARKQNLNLFFQMLEKKLELKPDIQIEFGYVCFHDQGCYDLRKELDRTNESMIERGIEGIMKPASLKEIWENALKGTTWPSILTIKLLDSINDTVGRISIVDLLQPRFSSLVNAGKDKCYFSFQKLVDTITAVTTKGYIGKLSIQNCFLTNELEKFIVGRNKFILVGFMNDTMVTEIQWRETKSLLNLMQAVKDMPVRMVPNSSAKEIVDNKNLKLSTVTMGKQNKALKSSVEHLQGINDTLQSKIQHFQMFHQVEKQQMDYTQHTIEQYHSDYAIVEDQIEASVERLKEKNKEISLLSSKIVELNQQLLDTEKKEQVKKREIIEALEQVLKELHVAKKQIPALKNENRELQRELDTIENDNQYLKVQIQKKRTECFQANSLYDEEKAIREKLEQKLRNEISTRRDLEDKLEKKSDVDDLEQRIVEKYELKKKKIQEKAQAKLSSFEPILKEKDDIIKELLEKLSQFEQNQDE